MTQYHYERPPGTAVESSKPQEFNPVRSADLRALSERIASQDHELQELRQAVRRLQNELRSAVNAFNLRRHG
jgi:hypothetical protein